jgi:drug/metabolite transporter (DMT)-like permease
MLVGLLTVVYALCYSAIKLGLPYAPPLRFAGLRAVLGGLTLLAAVLLLGQPILPPRRLWRGTMALAVLGTFGGYGAMFMSPGRTGAGISSVVGNTGPIFTVILAAFFLGEPLTRAKTVALFLGAAGVTAIAWPAMLEPSGRSVDAAFPLTAAISAAAASVLLKKMDVGRHLIRVATWQLLLGAIPLLLLAAALETGGVQWTPAFVALLAYLGLIGTALALSVWYWLIQRESVGRLSLFLFLVPVLGLGLATLAFGESMGPREVLGVGLVLAGVVLAARHTNPIGGRVR